MRHEGCTCSSSRSFFASAMATARFAAYCSAVSASLVIFSSALSWSSAFSPSFAVLAPPNPDSNACRDKAQHIKHEPEKIRRLMPYTDLYSLSETGTGRAQAGTTQSFPTALM
jgi:hypothetical protein